MDTDPNRRAALYTALEQLCSEFQSARLSDDERLADSALHSMQPFFCATLTIHQWLQWRFIPRLRAMLDQNDELPQECAIYPYAEHCLAKYRGQPMNLLNVIRELDELIGARRN